MYFSVYTILNYTIRTTEIPSRHKELERLKKLTVDEHAVQLMRADMHGLCRDEPALHWEWRALINLMNHLNKGRTYNRAANSYMCSG